MSDPTTRDVIDATNGLRTNPVADHSSTLNTSNSSEKSSDPRAGSVWGVVEGFYGRPWTSEQRKDLFAKMKHMGLNTYMYAPKDDFKHRAYWRELYTVEEAEQLSSLIQSSIQEGIDFYYAISPGLDITYSNPKEVAALKRKLEQVSQFGCQCFAILFDDIEPEISETDKEVFHTFAEAQVSVTNEVYQALGGPKGFLFCPTEYCAARAVPNVRASEYLNTIGSKLLPPVDIMWTGPKVISKHISVESIMELSEVLRRKPVIWDNIHANDYDQKRLFLGPYSGRSTDLIPHLRGVLTNPNNEYEPNFVAFHTLAQWSKCNSDNIKSVLDAVKSDIQMETETNNHDTENVAPNTYHRRKALQRALQEWLPEFDKVKNAVAEKVTIPVTCAGAVLPTAAGTNSTTTTTTACTTLSTGACCEVTGSTDAVTITTELAHLHPPPPSPGPPHADSDLQPISKDLCNSLAAPDTIVLTPLEAMDTGCGPLKSDDKPEELHDVEMDTGPKPSLTSMDTSSKQSEVMETGSPAQPPAASKESDVDLTPEEPSTLSAPRHDLRNGADSPHLAKDEQHLTMDDLVLLVDLFYLPFEHGWAGMQLINEFYWLTTHEDAILDKQSDSPSDQQELADWRARAHKFDKMVSALVLLMSRISYIKNRSLLYDIYPYLTDLRSVVTSLNGHVQSLLNGQQIKKGSIPAHTWFTKGYSDAFSSGDSEPWAFRGGLSGELSRLMPIFTTSTCSSSNNTTPSSSDSTATNPPSQQAPEQQQSTDTKSNGSD